MFGWGATEMFMAISQNYSSGWSTIYTRCILGRSHPRSWYRLRERGVHLSLILAAGPLGSAFGRVIAYAVGSLDRDRGLEAWIWLFVIEGAPSCLLAIVVYLFLPSYPEKARWLFPDDRAMAILRMKQETSKPLGHATVTWQGPNPRWETGGFYLHHLVCILISVPMTIVDGFGYEGQDAQLFTVPPFALAFSITVTMSWVADRYRMWST
ncbi:hypothetical protein ARMGADRAFT_1092327 [Armillaria gallica]|uniref:MFS general substrate transporter n=1 Tax=Armillaria gallica TaxID=47427 RepID=A0A2H3CB71_ARMGA|nr:hypothetical protein ARMGADRAFT_1092327 [Armillaria gallica]